MFGVDSSSRLLLERGHTYTNTKVADATDTDASATAGVGNTLVTSHHTNELPADEERKL